MYRGRGAWCTIRHCVIALEMSEDKVEYCIVAGLVLLVCC